MSLFGWFKMFSNITFTALKMMASHILLVNGFNTAVFMSVLTPQDLWVKDQEFMFGRMMNHKIHVHFTKYNSKVAV